MSKKSTAPPPTQQQRLTDRLRQASRALEQKPGAIPAPKGKRRNPATGRFQKPAA
jgi:hypothetical protein